MTSRVTLLARTDILSLRSRPGILTRVANRFPSLKARALLAVLCRPRIVHRRVHDGGNEGSAPLAFAVAGTKKT